MWESVWAHRGGKHGAVLTAALLLHSILNIRLQIPDIPAESKPEITWTHPAESAGEELRCLMCDSEQNMLFKCYHRRRTGGSSSRFSRAHGPKLTKCPVCSSGRTALLFLPLLAFLSPSLVFKSNFFSQRRRRRRRRRRSSISRRRKACIRCEVVVSHRRDFTRRAELSA